MKRFLLIVALFLAPVLLFVALFAGAVYASGEWHTEEEIAAKVAAGEPAFLGLAYRDNTRYYKHLVANALGADLLVLGTSRSMQFHSEFFTTDSFYNAGGGAGYVNRNLRMGGMVMQQRQPCSRCGGKGKIVKTPCSHCHGTGKVATKKSLEVKIPAGIGDDQSIALRVM